ncbi:MAG: hypothetical protein AAF587_27015 [Bacteroidota bacterium]
MKCLFVLLAVFLFSCEESQQTSLASLLETSPIIIKEDGPALFQYWELAQDRRLWEAELGNFPALEAYKDSLIMALGDSLLRQLLQRELHQAAPPSSSPDSLDNYHLIHEGHVGKIQAITYLEAEILNYQLSRFPLFSHPTEFHGFILQNDSLGRIRIYFGASDQGWPPKATPLVEHMEGIIDEGWRLSHHLHNHYESAENNYLGIMAPSLADAHYFKVLHARFEVEEARITNGFCTLLLSGEELNLLNSH